MMQESYVERYHDCPREVSDTVLHLLKHMLRFGGSPRGLFEVWCREHQVGRKDQTCHELETLTEVVMLGGADDQVSRRLQLITKMHAEVGYAPSRKMARCHNGLTW